MALFYISGKSLAVVDKHTADTSARTYFFNLVSISFISTYHLFGYWQHWLWVWGSDYSHKSDLSPLWLLRSKSTVCNSGIQLRLERVGGWVRWLSATNTLLCKYSERSLDFKFLATCEAKYTLRTAAEKRLSNCLNQTWEELWLVHAKQRGNASERQWWEHHRYLLWGTKHGVIT